VVSVQCTAYCHVNSSRVIQIVLVMEVSLLDQDFGCDTLGGEYMTSAHFLLSMSCMSCYLCVQSSKNFINIVKWVDGFLGCLEK
jgi:hypothetical protein